MHEHESNVSPDAPAPTELDILIGRIIDGEAGAADRARFEELAGADPALWRQLAARQQDMLALTAALDDHLEPLNAIELPDQDGGALGGPRDRGRAARLWAVTGWAAVIALAATLAMTILESEQANLQREMAAQPASRSAADRLRPEDHLKAYLRADYVLGELPPTLLEVQELPDGRQAALFLRRIHEVAFLDPKAEIPVDDEGNLTQKPEALRESTQDAATPN